MAFHDVRLPTDIERGAVGGPEFSTTVFEAASGYEQRNVNWAQARGSWDVGYGLLHKFKETGSNNVDVDDLVNFFYARRGRAHSYRFRDWADYDIGSQADPANTAQEIGLGDDVTTDFQVFKRYSSGGVNFDRTIYLVVAGTIFLYKDGVLQADPADYSINLLTGVVSMVVAPASTGGNGPGGEEQLEATLQFDNHVRFDIDHLQINMEVFNAGSWPNIPIKAVRGGGA